MEHNFTYNQKTRQERLTFRRRRAFRKSMHTLVSVLVLFVMVLTVISANAVIARAGEGYEKQYEKQYVGVLVESGDTVWDIASEQLSVGYDTIAELVEEIGFINDLNSSYEIQSGSVLIIPYYCEV